VSVSFVLICVHPCSSVAYGSLFAAVLLCGAAIPGCSRLSGGSFAVPEAGRGQSSPEVIQ
jgi:hypothetical protein